MREEFLHFVWQNKKFKTKNLRTSSGESIKIFNLGRHNRLAGPDFFNAKLEIGGQLWAGNVEMHLKASDWYVHGHENDVNYDNVVLHVVWDDDVDVFRKDGSAIPALRLSDIIEEAVMDSYRELLQKKTFINCENDFCSVDEFAMDNWMERLFIERLEQKSQLVFELLERSKNDWEKVLFCLLMKNFGLNHNGTVFLGIAEAIDFKVFRKVKNNVMASEALLFGMAGLFEVKVMDSYQSGLAKEFAFLVNKFGLRYDLLPKPNFYGLRPNNFPTIRLSQLAALYHSNENLFQNVIKSEGIEHINAYFNVSASEYWDTHYVFGKESSKRKKKLSQNFIDLVIINTIIPVKFCHAKKMGKPIEETLFNLARALKPESNKIITGFNNIGPTTKTALESQAKLQLYSHYCNKNRCLKCMIGNQLLK